MSREVKYLSAKQVAERYGLTVQWVWKCKALPRRKVGKYLMFREDELERFELYRNHAPNVKGRGYSIPTIKTVIRPEDIELVEAYFPKRARKYGRYTN